MLHKSHVSIYRISGFLRMFNFRSVPDPPEFMKNKPPLHVSFKRHVDSENRFQ